MKTKDIPAIVMLLAGSVYCLIGIRYQIPLMDFLVQLLTILLIFWIIGGIVRMFLDRFMGEIEDKTEAKEEEADETDAKESETQEEGDEEEPSETQENE